MRVLNVARIYVYNVLVIAYNPSLLQMLPNTDAKSREKDFHKLFKSLPDTESLIEGSSYDSILILDTYDSILITETIIPFSFIPNIIIYSNDVTTYK